MEHLIEPARFLARAATLLRPGGHCFILVPNLESLAIRLCGPKYRYVMPDHLNYFSAGTLVALAKHAPHLEVLATRAMHFNPVVIWRDMRGGTGRVPDAERARLLKRTTALKQKPWMRPVKWLYGVAENALAKRGRADNLVMVLRKK
ncbi:MAG TPA: methyltransferase domain-containing protein, partial [Verrucomicrobiae bacterium]|nr:methyltransferase domain-containing protein [Verrucomicrobiae bacterium]